MKQCMLTTIDNPFDPFEQFDSWLAFDNEKGYNSSGRYIRLANLADNMSEPEILAEVERAIDRVIELDITHQYKKVSKEVNYPED